jgi:serine/threonine protein kinase/serine/threonine protein phosphatase PrpC
MGSAVTDGRARSSGEKKEMETRLAVSIGQCSDKGRKEHTQDFHGAIVPSGAVLALKGVAVAIADGISTSPVAHVAAETAVTTFLSDYYCTSDAWSVRTSATKVITAINAWLHSQTRLSHDANDLDRGYLCTFSALIFKGRFAHVFHIGDSRIYRVVGDALEPLTTDHRIVISASESYLGRALGMAESAEIECSQHPLSEGDVFLLCTDGVFSHVTSASMVATLRGASDLNGAARAIVDEAIAAGSDDNLTLQVVRIESLPDGDAYDYTGQTDALTPPPIPSVPCELDGYRLRRTLHVNERSHTFLATDGDSGPQVALKIPAESLRQEAALLRQFMMEEWIARRVVSPHVLRAYVAERPRNYLYVVTEYVEGQSLRQWMHDHPRTDLATMRDILEQIVRGVRAMHRMEMIHCDLRPENVLIDRNGTIKIIDFGSVRVTGLVEAAPQDDDNHVLGTVQYTAPEWLAGEAPTWRSDLFSIAVIAYEMLTGELPYGAAAARVRSPAHLKSLRYRPAHTSRGPVPRWIDGALGKALSPDPARRHDALSEFIHDLSVPNPQWQGRKNAPLIERNPVAFWRGMTLLLGACLLMALFQLSKPAASSSRVCPSMCTQLPR